MWQFHYRHSLLFILCLLLSAGCVGQSSRNETYPHKPIKIIIPFKPGGESDTFSRIIKKAIEDNDLLPVPLVILNRDGAGATVGSRSVKNAPADGYTILMLHNALFTAKYSGNAPYGPEAFAPIAGTAEFGMVIAVAEESPFHKLDDLMKTSAKKPDTISFGVYLGTPSHFAGLMLEKADKDNAAKQNRSEVSKFRFIQTGSGVDRYAKLRGGHIKVSAFSIGEYVRFEKLRALAFLGQKRHPDSPKIPTAVEQGYQVTTSNMQFWWAPKKTPKDRTDYLAKVLRQAMATKYVKKELKKFRSQPVFLEGMALQKRIDEYTEKLDSVSLRKPIDLPDFPLLISCTIVGLFGLIVVRRLREHTTNAKTTETMSQFHLGKHHWQLILCALITVGYVIVLDTQSISFRWLTAAYVLVLGLILVDWKWRKLLLFAILAIVLGIGLHFVFTEVFVIDLP